MMIISLPEDVLNCIFSVWLLETSLIIFDTAFCCRERIDFLNILALESFFLQSVDPCMIQWIIIRYIKVKKLVMMSEFPLESKSLLRSVEYLKFHYFEQRNILPLFPFYCNVVDVINSCNCLTQIDFESLNGFNEFFLCRIQSSILANLREIRTRMFCQNNDILWFSSSCHNLTSLNLHLLKESCSSFAICELLKANKFLRTLRLTYDNICSAIIHTLSDCCVNLEVIQLKTNESFGEWEIDFYRHCVCSTRLTLCTLKKTVVTTTDLSFSYLVSKQSSRRSMFRSIIVTHHRLASIDELMLLLEFLKDFNLIDLRNFLFTSESLHYLLLANSKLTCLRFVWDTVYHSNSWLLQVFSQIKGLNWLNVKSSTGQDLLSLELVSDSKSKSVVCVNIDEFEKLELYIDIEENNCYRAINFVGDYFEDNDDKIKPEILNLLKGYGKIVLRNFPNDLLSQLNLLQVNNPDLVYLDLRLEEITDTLPFILDLFEFLNNEKLEVLRISEQRIVQLFYYSGRSCVIRMDNKKLVSHSSVESFRQIFTLIDPVEHIQDGSFCFMNFHALSIRSCSVMDDNLLSRVILSNPNMTCFELRCDKISKGSLYDLTHCNPLLKTLILHDCSLGAAGIIDIVCDCTHIVDFVMYGVDAHTIRDYGLARMSNPNLRWIQFCKTYEDVFWLEESYDGSYIQRSFQMRILD